MKTRAKASAPGKVILSGEHSVVYGYPAIAASIATRVFVEVTMNDSKMVSITSNGYFDEIRYSKEDLKAIKQGQSFSQLDGIASVVEEVLSHRDKYSGMHIEIDSQIPMGAGLGSSASVCVATVKALSEIFSLNLSNEDVSKLAYEGERVIHGTPSGIDNSTSTFGGLIKYVGGKFDYFDLSGEFPLVIANTKVSRSTKTLVSNVRQLKDRHPQIMQRVFQTIGDISSKMLEAMLGSDLGTVGELMDINQGLLDSIGVGHPVLTEYIQTARANGALGAKLTGAGGGGCMIALAKSSEDARQLSQALEDIGAEVINTRISPEGVRSEEK